MAAMAQDFTPDQDDGQNYNFTQNLGEKKVVNA
jgi:hypothetical protein